MFLTVLPTAQKGTIRPAESGQTPTRWRPHGTITQRRCCQMVMFWSRVALAQFLFPARNCMIPALGHGQILDLSLMHAIFTLLRCFSMERYWLREAPEQAAQVPARNCT